MNAAKGTLSLLVFLSFSTLLSLWSLYAYRYAPALLVISAIASLLLLKRFPIEGFDASPAALALCALVAFLAAYPYLLVTPLVDASADPAAHISSLAIGSAMPLTYGVFSQLEYRYQPGFPLLAKMLIDLLPSVQSGFVVWALGVLFAFMSAMLAYLVAKQLFSGDERLGLLSLALFIGSKVVFQNMYWGQYTFMMASAFFLATLLMFLRGSILSALFFPVVVAANPGVLAYALVFFAIWAVFFRDYRSVAFTVFSGVIALPALFISYLPYLRNTGAERAVPLSAKALYGLIAIFPPWIGLLVFMLAIASIAVLILRRSFLKAYTAPDRHSESFRHFFALVFVVSSVLSVFFFATGRVLGGRVVELAMFSGLFLSLFLLNGFIAKKPAAFMPALIAITVISLALFFSSSELTALRNGTKISSAEIAFSESFRSFDPSYRATFFLTPDGGKMAEVSQKIPYDVMSQWYLSYDPRIAADDPYYGEALKRHSLSESAIEKSCAGCVVGEGYHYLVADKGVAVPAPLREVFRQGSYVVYVKGTTSK